MAGWRFPILDGGNEQGFNNSGIETFNGSEIYDNLAREICQNSLDAKDDSVNGPVIVKFSSKDIKISDYDTLKDLFDIIAKCREYWKNRMDEKLASFFLVTDMLKKENKISVLVASDYNTCGLEDAKAGRYEKSVWRALTHSDGVSTKKNDSGGSYGIGKNAPFACSQLRTVFYNTYAKDGIKAFQGTTRLMTHIDEGEETVGTGHYFNLETKGAIFDEDKCEFRDIFLRDKYGTDVIILGFEKSEGWQDAIERAIVKNFFMAIYEGNLIVYVDGRVIDSDNLAGIINKHSVTDSSMMTTKEFFEARVLDDHVIRKAGFLEEDDVELYVRVSADYSRVVAELRNTGMIIRTRGKNVPKAYSAVMVVRGSQMNRMLKSMEPPKHDRWDPDIIMDAKERAKGKRIRKNLIAWVNKSIDEICKSDYAEEFDPDGISQFLPDELEDGKQSIKKNIKNIGSGSKVLKIVEKKIVDTNIKTTGKNIKGLVEDGSVNNAVSGAKNGSITSGVGSGNGNDKVATPEKGTKLINRPVLLKQRIFQSGEERNTYKAVIMLEDNCENVYISVTAIGDDGMQENLKIARYEIKGIVTDVNKEIIGPLRMEGNVMQQVTLKLEHNEKMRLKLNIQ